MWERRKKVKTRERYQHVHTRSINIRIDNLPQLLLPDLHKLKKLTDWSIIFACTSLLLGTSFDPLFSLV